MGWWNRIVGGQNEPGVPRSTPREQWRVAGIYFDTPGWVLASSTPDRMSWTGPNATLSVRAVANADDSMPATLHALRDRHRAEARLAGGDIVLVEPVRGSGRGGLAVATKWRAGMAENYRLTIQLRDTASRGYTIDASFDEGSSTGNRSALVNAIVVQTCGLQFDDAPVAGGGRTLKGYFQDAYDPAFDQGALNSYTDDERVDEFLPGHPLSLLRYFLGLLESSLELNADWRAVDLVLVSTPPAVLGPRRLLRDDTIRFLYEAGGRTDLLIASLQEEIWRGGSALTRRLAICRLYLGCVHAKAREYGLAAPELRQAAGMFAALGEEDSSAMAEAQTQLGVSLRHLGQTEAALAALRIAIPLYDSHPEPRLEALAVSNAAAILESSRTRDDREEAARYLTRAQELLDQINAADKPRTH